MYLIYLKVTIIDNQLLKIKKKMTCNVKNINEQQQCGLEYAFKRIGGKYKARILWLLRDDNTLRYGELRRTFPEISTKMLTQCLKELDQDNLILRKMYHQVPPKVEYSLTTTGEQLMPFFEHLNEWAQNEMANEKAVPIM